MGKNIRKNVSHKYSQKNLNDVKQSAIDALKTASKKQFKKWHKKLVIWLIIKLLIKLQKFQESRDNIKKILKLLDNTPNQTSKYRT